MKFCSAILEEQRIRDWEGRTDGRTNGRTYGSLYTPETSFAGGGINHMKVSGNIVKTFWTLIPLKQLTGRLFQSTLCSIVDIFNELIQRHLFVMGNQFSCKSLIMLHYYQFYPLRILASNCIDKFQIRYLPRERNYGVLISCSYVSQMKYNFVYIYFRIHQQKKIQMKNRKRLEAGLILKKKIKILS